MRCWPACRRNRDLCLDRADHPLRDLRHQPGPGRRAGGGGLADDRRSDRKHRRTGSPELLLAAITLAFLSGAFLILLGVFRLGFLANFLSHPVIAGFITASGISLPCQPAAHVLGIRRRAQPAGTAAVAVRAPGRASTGSRFAIGVSATAFLFWVRKGLKPLAVDRHEAGWPTCWPRPGRWARLPSPPSWPGGLTSVKPQAWMVGDVPQGLPPLTMPSFSPDLLGQPDRSRGADLDHRLCRIRLCCADAGRAKRQRIVPDQELIGLGAANVGAAFTGGYPVTGGFRPFGRQLRRRCGNARRRRLHRGRTAARSHAADPADLQPAAGDACRHHHRRGAVAGGLLDPEEDLGLFARRFRRRQRHHR
jgi:hypothetical protein